MTSIGSKLFMNGSNWVKNKNSLIAWGWINQLILGNTQIKHSFSKNPSKWLKLAPDCYNLPWIIQISTKYLKKTW